MTAVSIIETEQEVCKLLFKTTIDSRKLAAKKALLNIFLALLVFVYLYLNVQKSKIIEDIPDLVLFVNKFAKILANIFIPRISSFIISPIQYY